MCLGHKRTHTTKCLPYRARKVGNPIIKEYKTNNYYEATKLEYNVEKGWRDGSMSKIIFYRSVDTV